jgi:hypothetical protein
MTLAIEHARKSMLIAVTNGVEEQTRAVQIGLQGIVCIQCVGVPAQICELFCGGYPVGVRCRAAASQG